MTLKMRTRSLTCSEPFSLSQRYIYTCLEEIHPLVQKIFHLQDYDTEEVNVTKIESALKFVTMIYL